ncbi:MAG: hypothetical protein NXI10_01235 [bacterium]|nr:hypothetical protein [bacterium]
MKRTLLILAVIAFSVYSCNKKGCTDPNALNYNAEATKDDGSCNIPETNQQKIVGVWTGYQKITIIPGMSDAVDDTYSDVWEFEDAFNFKFNGSAGTYYFMDDNNIFVNGSNVEYKIFQLDENVLTLERTHPAAGSVVPPDSKIRYYHSR